MNSGEIASELRRGDRLALSKAITIAENSPEDASRLMLKIGTPGKAFVIGVTGPPGAGKSSVVDRLIGAYRKRGLKVGVIAVDPTSPITGGALLGDRIRMNEHAGDAGVFIRSMAARGWSGGLSRATSSAIRLMDAAGLDVILLETVGIGQSDIEVVGVAHAVLVVLMPGVGDDIQVSKAGLMEVGDVYLVNKSDLEGADGMVATLLGVFRGARRTPSVLKASAMTGQGMEELSAVLEEFRSKFSLGDRGMRLRSVKGMIIETARAKAMTQLSAKSKVRGDELAARVLGGKMTIESAALKLSR